MINIQGGSENAERTSMFQNLCALFASVVSVCTLCFFVRGGKRLVANPPYFALKIPVRMSGSSGLRTSFT